MLQLFLRSASNTDKLGRWQANRARGSFPGKGMGKGNARGTHEALLLSNALTLVCKTTRCSALIHKKMATRHAVAAGREHYEPGDGCGSRLCAKGRYRATLPGETVADASTARLGRHSRGPLAK